MTAITTHEERRKRTRRRPQTLVYVELAAANGGMMRDLSDEAFAVRSMIPLNAGEITPFAFSLTDNIRIEGQGLTQWVRENGLVAGIGFAELSVGTLEQIREWLERPEAPAPQPEQPNGSKDVNMEQLREEMYSVPPRPEFKDPVEEEPSAEAPAPEIAPPASQAAEGVVEAAFAEPQASAPSTNDSVAASAPQQAARAASFAPPKSQSPSKKEQHWKPIAPDEQEQPYPEADFQQVLPDISTILTPPPRRTRRPPTSPPARPGFVPTENATAWEMLPPPRVYRSRGMSISNVVSFMTFLVLLVALYVFHREVGEGLVWLGQELGGITSSVQPNPAPNPGASVTPVGKPKTEPQTQPEQRQPPADNNTAAENSSRSSEVPHATPPPAAAPSPGAPAPAASNFDAGEAEYAQALQVLGSRNAERDMPEALRLLWVSVEKGNINAEVQLAEMYWQGRGVMPNCQQATVLLVAASRKGSPEAQRLLQQLQRQGCR